MTEYYMSNHVDLKITEEPPSIKHCQLHGEPYECGGFLKAKYTLPSGKNKQQVFPLGTHTEKIISVLEKKHKGQNIKFNNLTPAPSPAGQ